jgi:hypothetical protein
MDDQIKISSKDLTNQELQLLIMVRTLRPFEKVEIKRVSKNRQLRIIRTNTEESFIDLD